MINEKLKNSGELPIIGVNTFLGSDGSPTSTAKDVMRSTEEEKIFQIRSLEVFQKVNAQRRCELRESGAGPPFS